MAETMGETMEGFYGTPPTMVVNNATLWHNLTHWTAQRLGYAVNMSKFTPSIEDLVKAGPRMVMKLGRLGGSYISFPDAFDGFGQRVIPESTDGGIFSTTPEFVQTTAAAAVAAVAPATAAAEQDPGAFVTRFSAEGARGIGSVFSYATSKWALCCFAMAIILNRTLIFAAPRRRFRLPWHARLCIRMIPILLLTMQARSLLQSIQCQTSPDFAELRWGNSSKSSELLFTQTDGFLHGLSSSLLLGATDEQSCVAVHMVPPRDEETAANLRGSLSRLWPLFGTFCLSNFVEAVSCAVQGRPVAAENGMTLFEHSLAFSEAEAAISNQLGWGMFGNASTNGSGTLGNKIAITRKMIMRRVNTPPEILLVAFLSATGHILSHISAIFNHQAKDRLIRTGINAVLFMGSIVWAILNFSFDDPSAQSLLRYPTVCIVGFVPHLLIFGGMMACFVIYFLALLLVASATPETVGGARRLTFRERFAIAHANMQANAQLADSIRVRMDMDFYTALLRTGFAAISMASEAVYLNEDRQVNLKQHTWLEDQRLREIDDLLRMQALGSDDTDPGLESIGTIGLVPVEGGDSGATSGYARERAAKKLDNTTTGAAAARPRAGIGAMERNNRWMMAIEYSMHINKLILKVWAVAISKFLTFLGVRNQPRLLRWLAARPTKKTGDPRVKRFARPERIPGLEPLLSEDLPNGVRRVDIPRVDRVDVESEVRQWLNSNVAPRAVAYNEGDIDTMLYRWWLRGGWWGSSDASQDYQPPTSVDDPDFDTTSVISTTETSESAWSDEDDGEAQADGQRTPTQHSFTPNPFAVAPSREGTPTANPFAMHQQSSRESTPIVDTPLSPADLSRLLSPSSPEETEQARVLASHLSSPGIVTRSAYRRLQTRERARVLLPPRFTLPPEKLNAMSAAQEAAMLEQVILSRRAAATERQGPEEGSWATGASGMGPEGPQCVVCQSAARTIIVWPCRCLSLCDDCRVSLAMNNFDKCVCCRRGVVSFSRIYVP